MEGKDRRPATRSETEAVVSRDRPSMVVVVLDLSLHSWMRFVEQEADAPDADAVSAAQACALLIEQVLAQLVIFMNAVLAMHAENHVALVACNTRRAKTFLPASVAAAHEMFADDKMRSPGAVAELMIEGSTNADKLMELEDHAPRREVSSLMRQVQDGVTLALLEMLDTEREGAGLSGADASGGGRTTSKDPKMSAALSLALCLINRAVSTANTRARAVALLNTENVEHVGRLPGLLGGENGPGSVDVQAKGLHSNAVNARVLIVSPSDDMASQYVPFMNCMFSAQRMSVPVDCCVLRVKDAEDSKFFQQASYLTSGIYLRVLRFARNNTGCLLQCLMGYFLADGDARQSLRMPRQREVDFRATCFATRETINLGWTCSVCLSSFRDHCAACPTCGVKFKLSVAARRAMPPKAPALKTSPSPSSSIS
ncbi:RNA polymerase II transcription factor B subunit 4 [Porphyridium purpureum]|uniref:RNA polymerase II transcription factor B subunit 4 n=1 Tax=Porphyridium purpureum TaxID=35688 RepID=A0A5J4Z7J9_PORPP|nr:RNA polymerase II transcription factor B subunit 4 [Porphyridium purpureum]|eukprot:POR5372..scf295_1